MIELFDKVKNFILIVSCVEGIKKNTKKNIMTIMAKNMKMNRK